MMRVASRCREAVFLGTTSWISPFLRLAALNRRRASGRWKLQARLHRGYARPRIPPAAFLEGRFPREYRSPCSPVRHAASLTLAPRSPVTVPPARPPFRWVSPGTVVEVDTTTFFSSAHVLSDAFCSCPVPIGLARRTSGASPHRVPRLVSDACTFSVGCV